MSALPAYVQPASAVSVVALTGTYSSNLSPVYTHFAQSTTTRIFLTQPFSVCLGQGSL